MRTNSPTFSCPVTVEFDNDAFSDRDASFRAVSKGVQAVRLAQAHEGTRVDLELSANPARR
jgi:hypothetical protein